MHKIFKFSKILKDVTPIAWQRKQVCFSYLQRLNLLIIYKVLFVCIFQGNVAVVI